MVHVSTDEQKGVAASYAVWHYKFVSRLRCRKMEKDVLIPALHIWKVLYWWIQKGFRLMPQNWRTVVFTMLILSCRCGWSLNYKSGHDQSVAGITLERINQLERARIRNSQIQLNVSPTLIALTISKWESLWINLPQLGDTNPYFPILLRTNDEKTK